MAARDPLVQEGAPGRSPKLLKLVGGGPGGHQGAGGKVPPRAGEESFTTSAEKDEKKGGSQTGKRDQREATCMRPVGFYHQEQGRYSVSVPTRLKGRGPAAADVRLFDAGL